MCYDSFIDILIFYFYIILENQKLHNVLIFRNKIYLNFFVKYTNILIFVNLIIFIITSTIKCF